MYENDGSQEHHEAPYPWNGGLTYPRSTVAAIYSAGLAWSGNFHDAGEPEMRMNGQVYNVGTKPGSILGIQTGISEEPASMDVRVWRIRHDYLTADLTREAEEIYNVTTEEVTQNMTDSIRNQYEDDWIEWPWRKGAPFYDLNHNGIKDADEEPGIAGADQVLWFSCNDLTKSDNTTVDKHPERYRTADHCLGLQPGWSSGRCYLQAWPAHL